MDMKMINDLGDDVLGHIISFLPTREAAFTCLLSKRWRYLFSFLTNLRLDYDEEVCGGRGKDFVGFTDRALALSGKFPTREISIKCRKSIDSDHVTGWIAKSLRRGLLKLDIDVIGEYGYCYALPPEIFFTCKNLVELKLAKGFRATLPGDVSFPSLKKLFLDYVCFKNAGLCVLGKLLSACPVLEELTVVCRRTWQVTNCCLNVSSSSLKKLTIECVYDSRDMTFDTPNLVYLEYKDHVRRNYPIVSLESLVEAKLDVVYYYSGCNPTNLIKGLRNVELLELSTADTWKIFMDCPQDIPVFSNLIRFSVKVKVVPLYRYDNHWEFLTILVKKSPNLETLVMKGPLNVDEHEQLGDRDYGIACPVKVLKITEYGGKTGELERMKHFLQKLPCLELVEVLAYAVNDEEKSRITQDLLMVPRPSKCDIQIMFCEKAIP
ncbi:unnamed protein product [Microthlaspi erraticum]|uniref:FBD domain-containing protein n=1 Tax=Microthlaspi erraticum TaxID=1685480 RepID=A0A6D2ISV6_9BRAS|nr:unnamed protein product [Microthlaspi erraticum]